MVFTSDRQTITFDNHKDRQAAVRLVDGANGLIKRIAAGGDDEATMKAAAELGLEIEAEMARLMDRLTAYHAEYGEPPPMPAYQRVVIGESLATYNGLKETVEELAAAMRSTGRKSVDIRDRLN